MVEKIDFTFSPLTIPNKEHMDDLFLTPSDQHSMIDFFPEPSKRKPTLTIETPQVRKPVAAVPQENTFEQGFMQLLDESFGGGSVIDFSPLATVDMFSAQTPNAGMQYFAPVETVNIDFEQQLPMQKKEEEKKTSGKKKTQEKKATAAAKKQKEPEKPAAPVDPSRTWVTTFCNQALVGNGEVTVKIKTRRDKPSEAVPERMYSSLKYVIQQTASGFPQEMPFVLSRIRVVDAETHQLVQKNQKDVLKGVIEAALTKPPRTNGNQFEGNLNVQFTDISYHVDKREICYEILYFSPDNLEVPILIKRSAPFKNFARKPNKKRPKNGAKRKREEDEDDDEEEEIADVPQPKKQRASAEFESFETKLNDLVEFNKKLPEEEKKKAMDLILAKFLQLDPAYAQFLMPQPSFLN